MCQEASLPSIYGCLRPSLGDFTARWQVRRSVMQLRSSSRSHLSASPYVGKLATAVGTESETFLPPAVLMDTGQQRKTLDERRCA
jgi:hypothetical protein